MCAEDGGSSVRLANFLGVPRKLDIKRSCTPNHLKEGSVSRRLQPECDAGRVRQHALLSVDGRMLGLLGVRTPQQVSRGSGIPEVSTKESLLRGVVIEYGEIRCVGVALSGSLPGPERERPGIRNHRQIHGGNRSTKAR